MEEESVDSLVVGWNSKRSSSNVWKWFDRITVDGKQKAKCKKCGKVYVSGSLGTSNLKHHIAERCPYREVHSYEGQNEEFDQSVFREKVAKAIIRHNYPYRFVEHEGIRDVFSYLNPLVVNVSRNTSKSDVIKIYQGEKERLKAILESVKSRICLTSDIWSSIASNGYMTVTAHYIDNDWVLQKKVLIFRQIPPPHNGQNVGEKLINYLQEWGIEKKIFTLTLDNASYNNGVVDLLNNHLLLMNASVCEGRFLHVRCAAHILNLIVQAGLKCIERCIEKIRDSVKYVRGSEARIIRFAECAKQLGLDTRRKLKQDMPVRWNSTYLMLDTAIVYTRAFYQLKLIDPNYRWCPTPEEWSKVGKITRFLKPFFELTELFSGQCYPTSNLYFRYVWRIQGLIQEEMINDDIDISYMATQMKPKFDKYWEDYSPVLIFAIVLDPRYKFTFVEFCFRKLDPTTSAQKVQELKDQMKLLFESYLHALPSRGGQFLVESSTTHDDEEDIMEEFDSFRNTSANLQSQSQLECYLAEPLVDRKQFPELDVLEFWKGNSARYSELSLMARDILSIPITTVASESAFSHGGRIIGKFRSSILPSNAEARLCARDWLEAYDSEDEDEKDLTIDIGNLIDQLESSSLQTAGERSE